jgi:hypothetical protein
MIYLPGLEPLRLCLLATHGPPLICDARHNISPRLRKQLVLKLEVGEAGVEIFEWLPSSVVG